MMATKKFGEFATTGNDYMCASIAQPDIAAE